MWGRITQGRRNTCKDLEENVSLAAQERWAQTGGMSQMGPNLQSSNFMVSRISGGLGKEISGP